MKKKRKGLRIAIILVVSCVASALLLGVLSGGAGLLDKLPIKNPLKDHSEGVDGKISIGEYTNRKVYSEATHFSANCSGPAGTTVTEYAAHDEDFVYLALVYNTDLASCSIRMNGKKEAKTDLAQSEFFCEFLYEFEDKEKAADVVAANHDFDEDHAFEDFRGDFYGKAAKQYEGDEVVSTTIELKLSKRAMKRVFEVDSVDFFGYYGVGVTPEPYGQSGTHQLSDIINAARFSNLGAGNGHGDWTNGSTQICQVYNLDSTQYKTRYRFMNFVVFGEAPAQHKIYCPADNCSFAGHADRETVMDLTDTVNLGTLPSNYVEYMLGEEPISHTTVRPSETEPGALEYKYISSGDSVAPVEYFGNPGTPSLTDVYGHECWSMYTGHCKTVVLFKLDAEHNSVRIFDSDAAYENGTTYYEETFENVDPTKVYSVEVTGGFTTGVEGCADVLGIFPYRTTDTKFDEHEVSIINTFRDSGDTELLYAADIDVTADTYYAVYFQSTDGNNIELEGIGVNDAYYVSPEGTYRYALFKSDSDKLTFNLNSYECVIGVYSIGTVDEGTWSPEETSPSAEEIYICSKCEYESEEYFERCPYCLQHGTCVSK